MEQRLQFQRTNSVLIKVILSINCYNVISMRNSLLAFLLFMSLTANARVFSKEAFRAANGSWSIGIMGGGLGLFDGEARGVFGLNLTIKGFYIDFMAKGSSHKDDVRVDKWNEPSGAVFHGGYQIPIATGFRVIPVVGYYTIGTTSTDGYDWKVTSTGISNKTSTSIKSKGVDYGGVLVFNSKHTNFYAGCTRYTLYGGIAIQF